MYWYDHVLRPFIRPWVLHFPIPTRPAWLHNVMLNHLRRWQTATLSAPFFAAQAAGVGITTHFWPIGTTTATIVHWYDDQLTASSPLAGTGFDYCKVFLLHGTEANLDHTQLTSNQVIADWIGKRSEWWDTARAQFANAVPPQHTGLYTVANCATTTLMAVLDRPR